MNKLFNYIIFMLLGIASNTLSANYEIVDLGRTMKDNCIFKINNNGTVLISNRESNHLSPFLYFSQTNEFFHLNFLGEGISIHNLNNKNEIVGFTKTREFSKNSTFVWSIEKEKIDLTPIIGNKSSNARLFINDEGWIGGYLWHPVRIEDYDPYDDQTTSSFLWKGENIPIVALRNLFEYEETNQSSVALRSMNNRGVGAGSISKSHLPITDYFSCFTSKAFIWFPSSKRIRLLDSFGDKLSSCAIDINDADDVVGISEIHENQSNDSSYHFHWHAVFWDTRFIGKRIKDCGTIYPFTDSLPCAINNNRQVVGFCFYADYGHVDRSRDSDDFFEPAKIGFIWSEKKGMQNLNDMIPKDCLWSIIKAFDINDKGQIICLGYLKSGIDEYHALLLNPINKPNTVIFDESQDVEFAFSSHVSSEEELEETSEDFENWNDSDDLF